MNEDSLVAKIMRRKKREQKNGPSLNNCNGLPDGDKKEECESRVMDYLKRQNKSSGGKTKRRSKKSKKSKKKRRTRRKGKKSRKSRK